MKGQVQYIGLTVLGNSPESCMVSTECLLLCCSSAGFSLSPQAAYWLLGSGAANTLVQSGAGGVQSQATVLLKDRRGGGGGGGGRTASNFTATLPQASASHTRTHTHTQVENTNV